MKWVKFIILFFLGIFISLLCIMNDTILPEEKYQGLTEKPHPSIAIDFVEILKDKEALRIAAMKLRQPDIDRPHKLKKRLLSKLR